MLNYSQIQTCSNLVIGNMEETFVMQQYIMKEGKLPNLVPQHPILGKRQFIGYSTTVADKISSYSIRIFDGFPK